MSDWRQRFGGRSKRERDHSHEHEYGHIRPKRRKIGSGSGGHSRTQSRSCDTAHRDTDAHRTQRRDHSSQPMQSRFDRQRGSIKYLSYADVKSLARSQPANVMDYVNDNEAGFLAAYEHEKFCKDPLMMKDLIKLLYLLVKCDDLERIARRILARILSTDGSYALFMMKLDLLIKEMINESRGDIRRDNPRYLHYLLEIGRKAISVIPETVLNTYPLAVLNTTIRELVRRGENLDTLEHEIRNLEYAFQLAREEQARALSATVAYQHEPPESFLHVNVLPSLHEMHSRDSEVYLRKNLVEGQYSNWDHYLDVQYRLLREDFVRPLRHGIQHYGTPDMAQSSPDIRVYKQVRVLNPVCLLTGIGVEIQFDVTKLIRVNWKHSQRLLFGSLLCLSADRFEHSIMFATVVKRDANLLQKGRLVVKFEGGINGYEISPDKVFTMVESTAYFEAYRHILDKLKEISKRSDEIPFRSYILGRRVRDILAPSYSLHQRGLKFDLCEILGVKSSIAIHDESSWPPVEATCLDRSQLEALKMALTKEISIIQGPPGTGKTFIGLKIVEAFLRNRCAWDPYKKAPILVVCYTNHALDQFLEGIQNLCIGNTTPNIVRIGGRCKSDKLADCILWKKVEECQAENILPHKLVKKRDQYRSGMFQNKEVFNKMLKCSSSIGTGLLQLADLKDILDERHYKQLSDGFYSMSGKDYNEIEIWLELCQPAAKELLNTDEHEMSSVIEIDDGCIEVDNQAELIEDDRIIEGEEKQFLNLLNIEETTKSLRAKQVHPGEWQSIPVGPSKRAKVANYFDSRPMSAKEVTGVDDVWMLPLKKRWQLYSFWSNEFARRCSNLVTVHAEQYDQACENYLHVSKEVDEFVLQGCDVIGMTTTGTAKHHHFLKHIHPKVVIFEEAAEIFEAHIVTSLAPSVQQLILIGDHKQLQPKPNCYDLELNYNLSVSLFERLIINEFPYVSLEVQHRMRPEISSLIHPSIYRDLTDHESVTRCDHVQGIAKDVYFVDHNQPEISNCGTDTTTHVNVFEADYFVSLCRYLLKQGYHPRQITILTMYRGQLLELKRKMQRKDFEGVRVAAVDDFQGEENDIILLSLVRSNPNQNIGFLSKENRVCVSLSRAKKGLYVIGDMSMLRNNTKTVWPKIIRVLEQKECVGKALPLYCRVHTERKVFAETPEDFNKCPEGGCDKPCGMTVACGHVCTRICHASDTDHANYQCLKACPKTLLCGHKCQSKCYECSSGCKPCSEVIRKVVSSCHHKQTISVKCSEASLTKFSCQQTCRKRLECGHACQRKCSEPCVTKCTALVDKLLPCGHTIKDCCYLAADKIKCLVKCKALLECGHPCAGTCSDCHLGRLHVHCKQKCSRQLVCGHTCGFPCASTCPPCIRLCNNSCVHSDCHKKCYEVCIPCMEPCEWQCKHHRCTRPCGEVCDRPPCNVACTKKLSCGHDCISLCGEKCPDLCRICDRDEVCEVLFGSEDEEDARFIILKDCGHLLEVSGLDTWVHGETSGEIKFPTCPKCKTPIRKSLRYCNEVKQVLKDVEDIKKKQLKSKEDLFQNFEEIRSVALKSQFKTIAWEEVKVIKTCLNQRNLHPHRNSAISAQIAILTNVIKIREVVSAIDSGLCMKLKSQYVICDVNSILSSLEVIKAFVMQDYLSQQQVSDVKCEIRRVSCTVKVCDLLCKLYANKCTLTSDHEQKLAQKTKQLYESGWKQEKLTEESEDSILKLIKQFSSSYKVFGLSEQERIMIVNAMEFKKGHWYKCPNGHIYAIGECGGAMQRARCPECGVEIGGLQHRLASGNQHAPEMDGSRHAAWSEAANLANFDPDQLHF